MWFVSLLVTHDPNFEITLFLWSSWAGSAPERFTYVFYEGTCGSFQALSRLEANVGTSTQLRSATFVDQENSSDQPPENIVLDKFDGLMSGEDESCLSDAGDDPDLGNSIPKSSPAGRFGNSPTLSVILRMDAAGRVSMLRKRITAVQSMSALSRDDCLWLFACGWYSCQCRYMCSPTVITPKMCKLESWEVQTRWWSYYA